MNALYVAAELQRTLAAVYRFYDAFFFPIDDRTPPVRSPLEVSIPALGWNALRIVDDATYRFGAPTLTRPTPAGNSLAVRVVAPGGDYVSWEPIFLTLPLATSVPPQRAEFLIPTSLWPTTAMRPPDGETAIRGRVASTTAQPVAGLRVEIWTGGAAGPPPGTPYTLTGADGAFLYRLPLLKGASGSTLAVGVRLEGGAVAVTPASPTIVLGQTQIIPFQRN